ncbi:hypothetical protein TNCV_1902931 [Trichonephila clavipes]|nr:hypothetical protein TNCV_1902931 [Trichonephila clavipes]
MLISLFKTTYHKKLQKCRTIKHYISIKSVGKTAAETDGMLQHDFNDDALENHKSMSGFPVSKLATCQPKTCHTQDVRNDEIIARINRAMDEGCRKTTDQVS